MKSTAHPGGRCIGLQANCKWERMLRSEDRAGDIGREIISVEGVIDAMLSSVLSRYFYCLTYV